MTPAAHRQISLLPQSSLQARLSGNGPGSSEPEGPGNDWSRAARVSAIRVRAIVVLYSAECLWGVERGAHYKALPHPGIPTSTSSLDKGAVRRRVQRVFCCPKRTDRRRFLPRGDGQWVERYGVDERGRWGRVFPMFVTSRPTPVMPGV